MPAEPFKYDGVLTPEKIQIVSRFCGDSVLDAGCNSGELLGYLKKIGKTVVGIDTDKTLITEASKRFPGIEFKLASLESIPYADNSMDTCVAWNVLEHLENDKKGFSELFRVAKKNIILTVPREDEISSLSGVTYRHYIDLTHKHYYTENAIKELVTQGDIVHLELISRVIPLMAYVAIGVPKYICTLFDLILWKTAKNKEPLLSVWLVVVEKGKQ